MYVQVRLTSHEGLLLFLGAAIASEAKDCSPLPTTAAVAESTWCTDKCPGCDVKTFSADMSSGSWSPSVDSFSGCVCVVVSPGVVISDSYRIDLSDEDDCLVVVGSGQIISWAGVWAKGGNDLLCGGDLADYYFYGTLSTSPSNLLLLSRTSAPQRFCAQQPTTPIRHACRRAAQAKTATTRSSEAVGMTNTFMVRTHSLPFLVSAVARTAPAHDKCIAAATTFSAPAHACRRRRP